MSVSAMSVLLIDDDDDALTLLQMMLRRRGLTTHTARNLAEARAVLLDVATIDVVVTDLELGDGEDGLMLHPDCAGKVSRFVVLTGRGSVAAPADVVVLQKPVDVSALLVAMGQVET